MSAVFPAHCLLAAKNGDARNVLPAFAERKRRNMMTETANSQPRILWLQGMRRVAETEGIKLRAIIC
jgi:hypothetical protein